MNHMKHHLELEKQNSESWESHTTCHHCYRQYMTPFQLQCHIESAHSPIESSSIRWWFVKLSLTVWLETYFPFLILLSFSFQPIARYVSWRLSPSRCSWSTWRRTTNRGKCLMSARSGPRHRVTVWFHVTREMVTGTKFLFLLISQVCNYRSSFFSDVETHFRSVHENTKDLLCPFCLKVLRTSHIYMQHYMKHQVWSQVCSASLKAFLMLSKTI